MAVEVGYAKRGEISIAFQAVGDGPVDIVFGCGLVSHLDLLWGDPHCTDFLRGLATMGRLILFDKPGTGLSDPVVGLPSVEQRMDDYLAVMNAAGSKRAVVVGYSEACSSALLLAALHPERVEALVALSGMPRWTSKPEAPIDPGRERRFLDAAAYAVEHWGSGNLLYAGSPYVVRSPVYRRLAPSIERACASPGMAKVMLEAMLKYDVVGVLDAIQVPTLVIHRTDELVPVDGGRTIAARVPAARLVELPGDEHFHILDGGDDILDAIHRFVGGSSSRTRAGTRRLATVLFTDMVESTATAARLGDTHWTSLLAHHDERARDAVERHDGELIKTTGDGVFASFERPLMAIRCALALREGADTSGIAMRAGIHTGECDVVDGDLTGIAVNIGARVTALAGPGDILVSSAVRDLVVGSGVQFAGRGHHDLKGVPGTWGVYAVEQDATFDQRPAAGASEEEAALTPGPSETMRALDKAVVAVATRAPRLSRASMRVLDRARRR